MTNNTYQNSNEVKLLGLEKYFKDLIDLLKLGKLPKILMLTGKKGFGKFTLIHHFISYYFDKINYDEKSLIIRKENQFFENIKESNNPNIVYLCGEDSNVKIENIRKLRLDLQKTNINNKLRFIILDDFELFNINCANALLKTLEEPSKQNNFIIINNMANPIIQTIKSRSVETKVFVSEPNRVSIIENLIKLNNLDVKINYTESSLSPGNFLIFNNICLNDKINHEGDIFTNIAKLLQLYKKKKNINYLNYTVYLTDLFYYKILKTNKSNYSAYDKKSEIIKKLTEFSRFNLNTTNVISDIKKSIHEQ